MVRRVFLIIILALLGVVLFINPNFKTIAAGVAILLFGMIMLEDGFKAFTKGPLQKILKASRIVDPASPGVQRHNFPMELWSPIFFFVGGAIAQLPKELWSYGAVFPRMRGGADAQLPDSGVKKRGDS